MVCDGSKTIDDGDGRSGQVLAKPVMAIGSGCVFLEIDFLVFYSSPKALDHHVADGKHFAISADRDGLRFWCNDE